MNEGIYHFNHDVHHVIKNGPILYMTGLNKIFENNNITLADLDLIVPHQVTILKKFPPPYNVFNFHIFLG